MCQLLAESLFFIIVRNRGFDTILIGTCATCVLLCSAGISLEYHS